MGPRRPVRRRTAASPTTATTTTYTLCDDLLSEILSRIPSPALSRFRSVCRDWHCRLIPSVLRRRPNLAFIRLRGRKPRLLRVTHDGALRRDLCSYTLLKGLLTICNGMALAQVDPRAWYSGIKSPYTGHFISHKVGPNCEYVVINPVDGRKRFIPPPAIPPPLDSRFFHCLLAFDPCESPLYFKLVLWARRIREPAPVAFLYSSRSNQWRRMVDPSPLPCCVIDSYGFFFVESSYCFNGRTYKITNIIHTQAMNILTLHACIAVFHIKEETLTWIESPKVSSVGKEQDGDRCTFSLGESGGSLVYAYRGARFLCVWALVEDDWNLKHRVDIRYVYPRSWPRVSSFSFHPHDTDVVFLIMKSQILLIFNLKTLKLREFRKLGRKHSDSIHPFLCSPEFEKPFTHRCHPLKEF